MKKVVVTLALFSLFVVFAAQAQDKKTVIENRCKELVRVLNLGEKDQWRKFIKENYTEAWINKKMRLQVQGGPDGGVPANNSRSHLKNTSPRVRLRFSKPNPESKRAFEGLRLTASSIFEMASNETTELESKVGLFQRFHDDLGKGSITNIKIDGDNADVQVKGETGLDLSFALKFTPASPHLIDGLGVQAMMGGPKN
jgi:hypothetical protein